jgi:hypothetical protein
VQLAGRAEVVVACEREIRTAAVGCQTAAVAAVATAEMEVARQTVSEVY